MSEKVKKKSDKKKAKDEKNKKTKKKDEDLNLLGDLDVREVEDDKEREEMYNKKLELIKDLYYKTK
jgi:hypothetical protein